MIIGFSFDILILLHSSVLPKGYILTQKLPSTSLTSYVLNGISVGPSIAITDFSYDILIRLHSSVLPKIYILTQTLPSTSLTSYVPNGISVGPSSATPVRISKQAK